MFHSAARPMSARSVSTRNPLVFIQDCAIVDIDIDQLGNDTSSNSSTETRQFLIKNTIDSEPLKTPESRPKSALKSHSNQFTDCNNQRCKSASVRFHIDTKFGDDDKPRVPTAVETARTRLLKQLDQNRIKRAVTAPLAMRPLQDSRHKLMFVPEQQESKPRIRRVSTKKSNIKVELDGNARADALVDALSCLLVSKVQLSAPSVRVREKSRYQKAATFSNVEYE
jgi:hypothetical protein